MTNEQRQYIIEQTVLLEERLTSVLGAKLKDVMLPEITKERDELKFALQKATTYISEIESTFIGLLACKLVDRKFRKLQEKEDNVKNNEKRNI